MFTVHYGINDEMLTEHGPVVLIAMAWLSEDEIKWVTYVLGKACEKHFFSKLKSPACFAGQTILAVPFMHLLWEWNTWFSFD